MRTTGKALAALSIVGLLTAAMALAADKYALRVPGGLAFDEFRGYERWQTVSVSHNDRALAVILGNPEMIAAFQAGYPGNGRPAPNGAKMAKIHWLPKKLATFPTSIVPAVQHDVDFMVKDDERFADSGGWGYAAFKYDAQTRSFRPATLKDTLPQANDARCGFACHTAVSSRDYVFTEYASR